MPFQRETTTLRADRILAEELACSNAPARTPEPHQKSAKLAIAARLREETTLTFKDIAQRLKLGTRKSANTNLHRYLEPSPPTPAPFRQPNPDG